MKIAGFTALVTGVLLFAAQLTLSEHLRFESGNGSGLLKPQLEQIFVPWK